MLTLEAVRLIVEFLLLALSVAVVFFLVNRMRKGNSSYGTAFFRLFVATTIAEIANFLMVLFFLRFFRAGYTPDFIMAAPLATLWGFLTAYCTFFQYVAHTAIAFNRFTAFYKPLLYQTLWDRRNWRTILCLLVMIPLPGAAIRWNDPWVKVIVIEWQGDRFYMAIPPDSVGFQAGNVAAVVYGGLTSMLTLYLEMKTLLIYRTFTPIERHKHKDDFLLLVYACVVFVGHLILTLFHFMPVFPRLMAVVFTALDLQLSIGAVQEAHSYAIDDLCFSGPICLLITR